MPVNDWSDNEVELIVADYFSMLQDELRGIKINKTQHREALIPLLNGRPRGSVEFKHQNISAVMVEMGLPFIRGYKPLYNAQKTKIRAAIQHYMEHSPTAEDTFLQFSDDVSQPLASADFDSWIVPPPVLRPMPEKKDRMARPVKINYLEREQRNSALGMKGEELVVAYERHRLISSGKEALADRVEWCSREQGDGLGFDILSCELSGKDRYIEVKTTKLSRETPFFFTANELSFSIARQDSFHLYRVFDYSDRPRIFMLGGRYDHFCHIEPVQYLGRF
ncbi:DUF3883 domain-containing protein [Mucilaginibacter sp. AK015]|uniref:DUF3883 domain-containing protein n=1 Tax=Mucilaginibacter sp. AK015 TaxID=2723072 RepID=UPI001618C43B|nr:DUF3883 domain-containing protein [Mucilaginibacter sp. AK015]MBB5396705.1 hypothetical protein [Mucilaginibacter sp. AK015]